jgi:hypothetical protein
MLLLFWVLFLLHLNSQVTLHGLGGGFYHLSGYLWLLPVFACLSTWQRLLSRRNKTLFVILRFKNRYRDDQTTEPIAITETKEKTVWYIERQARNNVWHREISSEDFLDLLPRLKAAEEEVVRGFIRSAKLVCEKRVDKTS